MILDLFSHIWARQLEQWKLRLPVEIAMVKYDPELSSILARASCRFSWIEIQEAAF
jgi:hypothetical protein